MPFVLESFFIVAGGFAVDGRRCLGIFHIVKEGDDFESFLSIVELSGGFDIGFLCGDFESVGANIFVEGGIFYLLESGTLLEGIVVVI